MKYQKRLRDEVERVLPEWKRQFICYKGLKKQLKLINPRSSRDRRMGGDRPGFATGRFLAVNNNIRERIGFTRLLHSELNKVNAFYFDKEEDYVIRLKEMQLRAGNLDRNEEKLQVQRDILNLHAEMVLLLHYSVLNFTGLVKIVKKHNKRTGTSFQFSSMPRVMQRPFFSTDLLYELMRQCETMLDGLFLSKQP
ncbi:SPX domain-containing protein 1-like [Populus nigra]|uniref:SPX domain-containing protein 1-like n=1 Tax=Populus nigra TaxID=3691 RepID=UPI002B2670B4|nr:SPX domain-containing protein 1-like [Populus nigra]